LPVVDGAATSPHPKRAAVITALTYEEAKKTAEMSRCAECGGGLLAPHLGNGVFGVKCLKDENHQGVARPRRTKVLADGKEYDVQTQRPVDERQSLAVPSTHEGMLSRVREAEAVGLWPQKMTPQQTAILVQVALAYGLDPFMQEIMPFQGRPYITINGRRRKDEDAGHHPSIKNRRLTADEKEWYEEAGALEQGDLCGMTILHDSVTGQEIEAFWKVTKAEREATRVYRDGPRKGQTYLASPVVAANPIELGQKRGERRAREMAYGPIARPAGMDTQIRVLEEGDVVEGQTREIPDANGDYPGLDMVTGEIREPQQADTGDIFPPDEAPDEAGETVPEAYLALVEAAGGEGLDLDAFCRKVLVQPSLERFQAMGGTPAIAATRWQSWLTKQKQQVAT